jgi:serine/threonine-protein kinase
MSAERAVCIFDYIVAAFGEAHDQGIVHRVIKPANVLLTNGDVVKVLDLPRRRAGRVELALAA